MKWRVLGAVVLALVVGGVVGAVAAQRNEPVPEGRVSFSDAEQLPARRPSLPVEIYNTDPRQPPLATTLPLTRTRLAIPKPNGSDSRHYVDVDVPVGWNRSYSPDQGAPPAARWTFTLPDGDTNGYVLRIDILTPPLSLVNAVDKRQAALSSAELQGFLTDVEFPEEADDRFTTTFVDDGYKRVSMERFFRSDDGLAYATAAVTGREQDVAGMGDLLDRITLGISLGQ